MISILDYIAYLTRQENYLGRISIFKKVAQHCRFLPQGPLGDFSSQKSPYSEFWLFLKSRNPTRFGPLTTWWSGPDPAPSRIEIII